MGINISKSRTRTGQEQDKSRKRTGKEQRQNKTRQIKAILLFLL